MAKFERYSIVQHKDGNVPYKIAYIKKAYTQKMRTIYRLEPVFGGKAFSVTEKTMNKNYIPAKTYKVLYGTR